MEAQITVVEPNGVRRSRPITEQGLTIGRGAETDLVINYQSASRHHAQVFSDGSSFYIVDLGSTNGTFLDDNRLPANVPTRWMSGQVVRIGDIHFELEFLQTSAGGGFIPGEEEQKGNTMTRVGWAPQSTGLHSQAAEQPKRSPMTLILSLVAGFLCLLAAGVAAAYFLFQ